MTQEQLLWGCKLALGAIHLQQVISKVDGIPIVADAAMTVIGRELIELIELHTDEPVDLGALLRWCQGELMRLQMEMDSGDE